ncbi:MAG: LCP family protein, partial [Bacillota bacterium]|nr:LCP family protein [Bacillota bacterium]
MKNTGHKILFIITLFFEAAFIFMMMLLNVLPAKYVAAVLALLAIADIVVFLLMLKDGRKKRTKVIGTIISILVCLLMLAGVYYMYVTYSALEAISKNSVENEEKAEILEEPFNIYITGIDMWGDIDQVSRSDVNMIMTVNPKKKEILLTSMPRDSYVVLHSFGEYDKLTHTGVWGVDETIQTVEDWLDTDINYYIRVDFSMLIDIVEAIDGIDVYSDYTFKSSLRDYHYKKGWNHLGGWKALYFARERHAFEDEDQQRILNQQKVMKACIRKVTSSKTLLTHYTDLLDVVKDEMETNMSSDEMAAL